MSDWGGTHSGVAALEAGLDMDMPGPLTSISNSYFGGNITIGVNNGSIPVSRLDDMVIRIMTPYFYLQENSGYPPIDGSEPGLDNNNPSQYNVSLQPALSTSVTHALITFFSTPSTWDRRMWTFVTTMPT